MKRTISAGLFDAGFAALATFAVSVFAARTLAIDTFGIFALYWAGLFTAIIVPAQFWFQPWEILSTRFRPDERLAFLRRSWTGGVAVATGAAVLVALLLSILAVDAPDPLRQQFAFSMAVAAFVSPLQDFVRRMLHVANYSARAAAVSLVQFGAVTLGLLALRYIGVAAPLVPFFALALGNVVSASVGIFLMGRPAPWSGVVPQAAEILKSGGWLLAQGVIVPLAGLIVNWILLREAGSAVLGIAEAARIVGRPVLVVTTGLGLALRPRSFEAAFNRTEGAARRVRSLFGAITAGGALVYAALVAVPWIGNPMSALVPAAYEVSWLAAAVCVANGAVGVSFPARYELIGAGRERLTTWIEIFGQAAKIAVAFGASLLGAFVVPVGEAALGLVRLASYRSAGSLIYREMHDETDPPLDDDGPRLSE